MASVNPSLISEMACRAASRRTSYLEMESLPISRDHASVPPVLWETLLVGAVTVCEMRLPGAFEEPSSGVTCLEVRGSEYPAGIQIALTDPRIHGGSLTTENLRLLRAFVARSLDFDRPFVWVLSTGGVRITQPRSIFQDVFGSIPDLFTLRRKNLLVTVALGKSLGIGALYFGQGQFRIAGGDETLINLTGPNVIKGFYGASPDDFSQYASAGHQFEANHLIQELAPTPTTALLRVRELLRFIQGAQGGSKHAATLDKATAALLDDMSDASLEIFSGRADRWKSFLCRSGGRLFGLIAQPPRNPDNMIGVAEVMRALDAVRLFKALRVPLISAIDSPGGDPRQASSDGDIVLRSLELADELAGYPFPKLGLLLARCYGGIGVFALPRDHGSLGLYALEGSRIGIMSDAIIETLVPPQSKLRAEWEETRRSQTPDMQEMLGSGNIQGFWKREELEARLGELFWPERTLRLPVPGQTARPRRSNPDQRAFGLARAEDRNTRSAFRRNPWASPGSGRRTAHLPAPGSSSALPSEA